MKIKPEHYEYMRDAIASIRQDKLDAHRALLENDGRVMDIEKRMRWDMMHAVLPSCWVCDNIYPYADDTHLDTALRAIVRELRLKNPVSPGLIDYEDFDPRYVENLRQIIKTKE